MNQRTHVIKFSKFDYFFSVHGILTLYPVILWQQDHNTTNISVVHQMKKNFKSRYTIYIDGTHRWTYHVSCANPLGLRPRSASLLSRGKLALFGDINVTLLLERRNPVSVSSFTWRMYPVIRRDMKRMVYLLRGHRSSTETAQQW